MRGKNCTKDEAFCKPSKSMSYTHRLVNRHLSNCDGVIVLLLSCLRCVCIAGEALRRPPRPLPLVTAFVGKRMNCNAPSHGLVNVHARVSAYQRSNCDAGACAAVQLCMLCLHGGGGAAPSPAPPPAGHSCCEPPERTN